MKLLSIVIPCYNSFKLLNKAFKSFERAENDDFEVIVIDDCSTDDSYAQLLKYKESAKFDISIFKNDNNLGPGPSRNKGIDLAKGKYITFLDSDDYYSDDFFEDIIPELTKGYDCVLFDYNTVSDKGKNEIHSLFFTNIDAGLIEKKTAAVYIRGFTVCKIYKRELISDINFLDQRRKEDIPFTKCAILRCDTIFYIKKSYYNYVMQENSLMHDSSLYSEINSRNAIEYINNKYGNLFIKEIEAIFAFEYLYSNGMSNAIIMKKGEWIKYIDRVESLFPNFYRNKYLKKYPIYVNLSVILIHYRMYFFILLLTKIKIIIKRIKGII